MRRSTRQATKAAAKARSSGVIIPLARSSSSTPQNKRIAFDDDDVFVDEMDEAGDYAEEEDFEEEDDDDDDIEEVTGSDARQSIQRIHDEERKVVKESILKKKRRKKETVADDFESKISHSEDDENENEDEEEEDDIEFTDDFFKAVDSERANQMHKAKKERKHNKILQKKMKGKHTTFTVEGDYDKLIGVTHKMEQNIEVVALGGRGRGTGGAEGDEAEEEGGSERQLVLSATLGSVPTKAAVLFARGGMMCGTAMERSSDSRKRKSKDDETWKRSKKMNRLGLGSRSGQAATLFVCKKK